MKLWSLAFLLALNFNTAFADEVEVRPLSEDAAAASQPGLPVAEKAFVDAINKFNKKQIVEQLGEPAKADDVRLKGSDKVVASIWHYHYVNTDENGTYYQTTELDFIEDKVVQVVFLNNEGNDNEAPGQTYEVPQGTPQAPAPEAAPNKELGDGMPLIKY